MWISILGIILICLWILYVIIHEIRAKRSHKEGFNYCDDCKGKGKALVASYKAMKKKEEKATKKE